MIELGRHNVCDHGLKLIRHSSASDHELLNTGESVSLTIAHEVRLGGMEIELS